MITLFLGEDTAAKDEQIASLKKKHLPSDDALQFDYEILYGHKLDSDTLKKALITLPVIAKKRIVLVRMIDKLSKQAKDIILKFCESSDEKVVLILDSDQSDAKNAFIKRISAVAKVQRFGGGAGLNVFDMTNAMSRGKPAEALKILSQLLDQGDHPLQILGALVWFWGKVKVKVSAAKFKKGLQLLQEADLNIKRSRLKPSYAVETLVINLCSLIA